MLLELRFRPLFLPSRDPANPADAPCSEIAGGLENPIVSRRPDNPQTFHAVYDGSGHPGFGYACSEDGLEWAPGVPITTPFNSVRTPYGLVCVTFGPEFNQVCCFNAGVRAHDCS